MSITTTGFSFSSFSSCRRSSATAGGAGAAAVGERVAIDGAFVGELVATDGAFVGELVINDGAFMDTKVGTKEGSEPSLVVRLASASVARGPWLTTRIPKRASKMGLLPEKNFITGMEEREKVITVLYECVMWFY